MEDTGTIAVLIALAVIAFVWFAPHIVLFGSGALFVLFGISSGILTADPMQLMVVAFGVAMMCLAPVVFYSIAAAKRHTLPAVAPSIDFPEREKLGSGELSGLHFDYYDDGVVSVMGSNGRQTRFPSFEIFERCMKNHKPSGEDASLYYEGWGKKLR